MENVIINALQAMEKGGTLTLKSKKDKEGFSIMVSDTGGGIPPESVPKIFDPLYTTKPKGTGLGLSVTKRLIEAHGGTITLVETSPAGTTFKVSLPAS
jgi:signal transduction histidine kinase